MGKVTIYLPDDLAKRVKDAGISLSPVCQRALEQELKPSVDPTTRLDARLDAMNGRLDKIILAIAKIPTSRRTSPPSPRAG